MTRKHGYEEPQRQICSPGGMGKMQLWNSILSLFPLYMSCAGWEGDDKQICPIHLLLLRLPALCIGHNLKIQVLSLRITWLMSTSVPVPGRVI